MRKNPSSNIKINILLSLSSIILSFFILEIGLRLFSVQEAKRAYIYDKQLGWLGEPNGQGLYIREKDQIQAEFRYNEYGFRDESFSAKPGNITRIVLVGDSIVEGLEVEYEKTFHKVFENRLSEEFGRQFEVINLSVGGYSTAQELLLLSRFKHIIDPDLVLLTFFTGNDFADNMSSFGAVLVDEAEKPNSNDNLAYSWLETRYLASKQWIYDHSYFLYTLKNFVKTTLRRNRQAEIMYQSLAEDDQPVTITRSLILKMKNEVERDQAKFGVLIVPSKDDVANTDYRNAHLIATFCTDNSMLHLDLSNALSQNHYFKYDGHLNEAGHAAVAQEMYKFLSEDGLLNDFHNYEQSKHEQ